MNADPLPGAWTGLPRVELLPDNRSPEAWFLPEIRTRIALPLETRLPLRIELLVNTTPSEISSLNSFRRNMAIVVPSMKVLMGVDPARGSIGLSIIDLNRRAFSYRQPDLRAVRWTSGDWLKLRPAFNELSAATIDVKTLEGRRKMLDYFAAQVARLLSAPDDTPRVLIVLSAPVFFTQQEKPPPSDFPPIRAAASSTSAIRRSRSFSSRIQVPRGGPPLPR
jgi:hypothetical protein